MRLSLLVVAGLALAAGCTQRSNTDLTTMPGQRRSMTMFNEQRAREVVQLDAETPAGYTIASVTDADIPHYDGDVGPAQLFEIVRPDNAAITIGRLWTSCNCIDIAAPQKTVAAGERALLVIRHVKPTGSGKTETFMFTVKINAPVETTLTGYVIVG